MKKLKLIIVPIFNYYVYRNIYLFSVIPAVNAIRILILYRNITNICHKLIIYSDWTHLININFVTYTELLDIITRVLCRNNVYS